jgi:ABC-2 type transport system ATP-binding protein
MNDHSATDGSAGPRPGVEQPALLEVRDAKRRFGERAALDGVSLAVQRGEIFALLGPNGAGKTTLIRSICGRILLDEGNVLIESNDPRENPAARSALGLVPQEIALYRELTVEENLEILGRLAGVRRSGIKEAVGQALDWTGLRDRASDRAALLSGGMQRRLNIAAGTLHNPRALLLDEPTVGVDPSARENIHAVLRILRDAGMAIMLTTHDMEQAEELADRVAIMAEGRICAEGGVSELVREHFGDSQELRITAASPPGGEARALLESLGLRPFSDGESWSGSLDGGMEALSGLGQRLAAGGLEVDEIRVREPGLRGVFFRVTGREFDT